MKLCASLLSLSLISMVYFATCDTVPQKEVSALTSFKEAVYEDPYLVMSNWNTLDSDPCEWFGVFCTNDRDHIIKLNISGSSLKGFIAPELGEITYLQELILHGNNLIGTIPKELFLLNSLKVLDLGKNLLAGPIPREIGNLAQVVKINLQSNGLTGRLPTALGNLRYLQELRLDRNKLQGPVPAGGSSNSFTNMSRMFTSLSNLTGLCRTPQLKVADLSYNFFVGGIPSCLEYLPRSSFLGNCFQSKELKQRSPVQCAGASPAKSRSVAKSKQQPVEYVVSKHHRTSQPTWLLGLEIASGTLVGSIFLVAILAAFLKWDNKSSIVWPWKKYSSRKDHMTVYIDSEILKDVRSFSRQELEVACEDFSNIIGSSPDSVVNKGTIKGGPEIAVISLCIKEEHWTGYLELYFQREVADLARLNHENTGKLLGYCRTSSPFTRMLVFEYASNGALHEHLHFGEGSQLTWTRRMRIIIGIAHGLKYLHTEVDPPFTILELNSNAVYLTEDFSPTLVDFESWKTILERSKKNSESVGSQGAVCVLPRSLEARHHDPQGNVYAFGVLLLEIISGRPPYCKDKGSLIDWAKEYLEMPEVMSYVVDPELKHFKYEDLAAICEVANLCINPDPTKRPSMAEICSMLESRIDMSTSVEFKSPSLAWAELALLS